MSAASELLLFWPPVTTVASVATNAVCTATVAAVAGKQQYLFHATISFSAAPGAPVSLTILSGVTVIWQVEISADARIVDLNFERRPLVTATGALLAVSCPAIGGTTRCTISMSSLPFNAP